MNDFMNATPARVNTGRFFLLFVPSSTHPPACHPCNSIHSLIDRSHHLLFRPTQVLTNQYPLPLSLPPNLRGLKLILVKQVSCCTKFFGCLSY